MAAAALAQTDQHPDILARHLQTAVILYRAAGDSLTVDQLEKKLTVQGFASPGYARALALLN